MQFDPSMLGLRTAEFQERVYEVLPLRLIGAFGLVCYSLSPAGARALRQRCFPLKNEAIAIPGLGRELLNFGIDCATNKHYLALKSYVAFPPLVRTENDKNASDVSGPATRSSAP